MPSRSVLNLNDKSLSRFRCFCFARRLTSFLGMEHFKGKLVIIKMSIGTFHYVTDTNQSKYFWRILYNYRWFVRFEQTQPFCNFVTKGFIFVSSDLIWRKYTFLLRYYIHKSFWENICILLNYKLNRIFFSITLLFPNLTKGCSVRTNLTHQGFDFFHQIYYSWNFRG